MHTPKSGWIKLLLTNTQKKKEKKRLTYSEILKKKRLKHLRFSEL